MDIIFTGHENYILSRKHYSEVFKLLIEIKEKYNIVNNPTAFMKIIDLAKTQFESLKADQVI